MNDIFKVRTVIFPELIKNVFEFVDMSNENLLNHPNQSWYLTY